MARRGAGQGAAGRGEDAPEKIEDGWRGDG